MIEMIPVSEPTFIFAEVGGVSLRDKVISSLKEAIFSGKLRPGEPIVERHLSQQMKIGTPAVREALVMLNAQGFVRRVANTATYVNSYTVDEVRELYQLRVEFEHLALKWAKLRVNEKDLSALESMIETMATAAANKEVRRFYELDLAFHRYCWQLSDNRFLVKSLENLVPPLFAFVLMASDVTVSESIAYEHRSVVNALRRLEEPEFSSVVRQTLSNFAMIGIASVAGRPATK
jgi:DNA-binding GntR family transcriptional regulator